MRRWHTPRDKKNNWSEALACQRRCEFSFVVHTHVRARTLYYKSCRSEKVLCFGQISAEWDLLPLSLLSVLRVRLCVFCSCVNQIRMKLELLGRTAPLLGKFEKKTDRNILTVWSARYFHLLHHRVPPGGPSAGHGLSSPGLGEVAVLAAAGWKFERRFIWAGSGGSSDGR